MLRRVSVWGDITLFFGLTFALSWGVGAIYFVARADLEPLLGPFGPRNLAFLAINCAPSLAAILASLIRDGPYGLMVLLGKLVRPFAWYWLVVSILIIPAVALALAYAVPYWDIRWPVTPRAVLIELPLIMISTAQLVSNIAPFGEELGWRGYALPLLLRQTNPYFATLILGGVWIFWHVPGFFIPGVMAPSLSLFGWWSLGTTALSMIMTFLFIRANGNIIVAGIIPHFIINAAATVGVWESRPTETIALALVAIVLAIALVFTKTTKALARLS